MGDEINRGQPPGTQSALLQAMQEHHVTVAGARQSAATVPRAGDPKPARAGRHLSVAGGAARSLSNADRC